jgi:hypothetical protein
MGWLRRAVDASTSVSSLPSDGTAIGAVAPKPWLLRPISAHAVKVIWEPETRTLTAGIILGLVIILAVAYFRSPWRKLPPSPRRLPILGHALHLRDKGWLLSKDCKERFGQFTSLYTQVDANVYLRKSQERSCTWTVLVSPWLCAIALNQLSNSSSAVRETIRIVPDLSWHRRFLVVV